MGDKEYEMFKHCFCFSKKDLLKSFSKFMKSEENKLTPNIDKIYQQFYSRLKETSLPTMAESWWYYDYTVNQDSIDLELCHCEKIELDDDDNLSSMTTSDIQIIFRIKCEYLTIESFAKMHQVSSATVKQWLKKGKLRSAKKSEQDWLIPEMAQKPEQGFTSGNYDIESDGCSIESILNYPVLKNAHTVTIRQDNQDSSIYRAKIWYNNNNEENCLIFNQKQLENFEVQLISDPNVNLNGSLCVWKSDFR